MKKHAYMIMAHNEFEVLKRLLKCLDDERNDIFLHIDKKAKDAPIEELRGLLCHGKIYFVPRMNVRWGHISQVKCEYRLLEAATSVGSHVYYHLISGTDMPLKTQDEIYELLSDAKQEFLEFHGNGEYGDDFLYKVRYYHPLLRWVGRGGMPGGSLKARMNRKLGEWQYQLQVWQEKNEINRAKKHPGTVFYKGAQWFSITEELAQYVLANKRRVLSMFRMTNCPDELFLPTLVLNSEYKERVANDALRLIDWERGGPYEFRWEDREELEKSHKLFVRKVSFERQPQLVEWLYQRGVGR